MGHGYDEEQKPRQTQPATKSPVDFGYGEDSDKQDARGRSQKALGRAYRSAAKDGATKRAALATAMASCGSTGDALALFAAQLRQAAKDLSTDTRAIGDHTGGDRGPDPLMDAIAGIVADVEGGAGAMATLIDATAEELRLKLMPQVRQVLGEWNPCWGAMTNALRACDEVNKQRGTPVLGHDVVGRIDRAIQSFPGKLGLPAKALEAMKQVPAGDVATADAASAKSDVATAVTAVASIKAGNVGDIVTLNLALGHLAHGHDAKALAVDAATMRSLRNDLLALHGNSDLAAHDNQLREALNSLSAIEHGTSR